MSVLRWIPVMWLPMAVYVVIATLDGSGTTAWLDQTAFSISMPSGDTWAVTRDLLVVGLAVICLGVELVRSALPTDRAMITLSLITLGMVVGLVLLLLAKGYATGAFVLILLMTLVNFLVSATVQVFTARRTLDFEGTAAHHAATNLR